MHPSLASLDHRPWPLPARAWGWRQSWCDLLFAHWAAPAAILRPLVPAGLEIEEREGTSWIGVVPFRMQGVMRRRLPDLPYFSAFPELNLRLYVRHEGKPGVWFLSLDAANAVAVWAARRFFHLPYHRARITLSESSAGIAYSCRRLPPSPCPGFTATYRATSGPYRSRPGSLEHWLTERYCLYAQAPDGGLWRTEVHHEPWPLQQAQATLAADQLGAPHGLQLDRPPDLLHFSRRIDVVAWSPRRVELSRSGDGRPENPRPPAP